MKKIITILITLLFVLSPLSVFAENTNFLNDYANIIGDIDKIAIESKLEEVSNKYDIDFVVVTTDDLQGKDDRQYSDDFYDENYNNEDGILVLIDLENSSWYVSTIGKCVDNISDYEIDNIYNQYVGDYLRQGEFAKGILAFVDGFDYYYNYDDTADIEEYLDSNQTVNIFGIENIVFSLIIAAIATLVTGIILKNQLKSVKPQRYAGNYVDNKSFVLTGYSNFFLGSHVSRTPIIKNDTKNSGGGNFGSGHSTHISSSGASHGGHGGHF